MLRAAYDRFIMGAVQRHINSTDSYNEVDSLFNSLHLLNVFSRGEKTLN